MPREPAAEVLPQGRGLSQLARDALGLSRTPLYRNSAALILSTGANGLTGLLFWVVAARLFDADEVGRGAAAVSALMLVSMLGFTGVQMSLIRFIPVSGPLTMRLALWAYAAAVLVAMVCAGVLLVAAAAFVDPLGFLVSNPFRAAAFLAAVAPWVIFSLEDGILIGLRRTNWVPLENASFGVIRTGLLVALSSLGGTWAVFVSWGLSSLLLIIPVNLLLFLRFIPRHVASAESREELQPGQVIRFSIGNHAGGVFTALPDSLMPLIVLHIAGSATNAYFYTARTLIFAVRLLGMNIANAFTAEAAARGRDDARLFRWAFILAAGLFAPIIAVLLLQSELVLRVFGNEYAENGAAVTRIMALGLLPFVVVALYTGLARVRQQLRRLLLMAALSTTANLTLGVVLVETTGIEGAGIAWLAAQCIAAAAALIMWSPRLILGRRQSGPENVVSQT